MGGAIAAAVRQVHHHGRDEFGVHGPSCFAHDALGHAGARDRRDGVDGDVVAGPLDRQHVHHPDETHLRRAIVRLPEVAEKAGARGGLNDPPVVLGAHDRPHGPGHVEGAGEVDGDHRVDLVGGHVLERCITKNACVVHQDVDPAEGLRGCRDDGGTACLGGDGVGVGDRGTAGRRDLVDDGLCGRRRGSAPVHCRAEVVHDDAGPATGEFERMTAPKTSARARHDRYLVVEGQ